LTAANREWKTIPVPFPPAFNFVIVLVLRKERLQAPMALQPMTGSTSSPGSGVFPILVFVQGNEQHTMNLDHTPFTVGRKVDKDLVVADPRVSRDHAQITSEDGQFCVVDQDSKHGTFVNGERVQRKTLERNDRVEFGVRDVAYVVFHPHHATDNTAREFLSQISGIQLSTDSTDLEKLTLFWRRPAS